MDDAAVKSERRFPALAVSRGIGIGPVVFYDNGDRSIRQYTIDTAKIEREVERLHEAVHVCRAQLNSLIAADESTPEDPLGSILNLQLLILEQSSFVENINNFVYAKRINVEWAVKTVSDEYVRKQSSVADTHLREKRLDIEDVCARILAALDGSDRSIKTSYTGAIVIAHELRPSSVIDLVKSRPAGLITERGGWTSHTSILAREFMMPMVSGVRDLKTVMSGAAKVIVDGESGMVIVDPDSSTVRRYDEFKQEVASECVEVNTELRSETLDGRQITIRANVDIPEAYHLARQFGAEGIGLFRSESLISKPGSIPTEDEQVTAYEQIAAVVGEAGVRIRTFDVGLDRLRGNGTPVEINPSLGLRSIRLSLYEQDHFRTQIRAILRASANYRIDLLLPMVAGVSEVLQARAIIDEEQSSLEKSGIPAGTPLIGAMIEVPSGIFVSREIARKVDFMALGTNDLVQYLLAVDRDNDAVSDWYQTLHPAVIRSIKQVLDAATAVGIPMLVCGEMAGSPFYVPLLIGLGATELSMNVNSISHIRRLISGITSEETFELARMIENSETSDEIESQMRGFYTLHWQNLFPHGLLEAKHR